MALTSMLLRAVQCTWLSPAYRETLEAFCVGTELPADKRDEKIDQLVEYLQRRIDAAFGVGKLRPDAWCLAGDFCYKGAAHRLRRNGLFPLKLYRNTTLRALMSETAWEEPMMVRRRDFCCRDWSRCEC